jgi:thiamine biosynthesis lipoprotein
MAAAIVRRARPLLGTFVEIRVEGLRDAQAARAIDQAFAEVATVHRLMSFHEPGSDLDRLHRARIGDSVRIDARTHEVLSWSARIASACGGRFDPTIAARQVASGLLPRPASAWSPHVAADWRDIELSDSLHVRLARPLWIDLGGIAKGYAVDRAVEILAGAGASQVCVNAGGDLRVAGARAESIHVRTSAGMCALPSVELANGALATSAASAGRSTARAPHVHERTRAVGAQQIVSVVAPLCVIADALTKVVLAGDDAISHRVLALFGAQAMQSSGRAAALIGAAA